MASPAGANNSASSSRGPPLPLPFPFPAATYFPSRAAVPFLPQHQHPPATSDGGEEVEEDEGSMDDDSGEEDEAELADGAAHGSQQRRASSAPGIGRAAMNGDNGARHIQEGHQWQQQSHLYNRGTEQYGCTSSGGDEPGTIPREMRVVNGYGVIGRREGGPASSYWDLLRAHLSDPLTGVLMDDAMILSCGHSYGSGGMQHIYRMKACGKCGQPITEDTIRPNLALRLAVQAFKREEDSAKTLKRRRERLEQVYTLFPVYQLCFKFWQLYVLHVLQSISSLCEDKCGNDDPNPTEPSRGKGVQFPFSVFDRVIIKGNKRTPERFVGRQAVVTAQCLNGWYVVKTLDNAESVKLQYRSLAKVADGNGSSAMASSNAQSASWL